MKNYLVVSFKPITLALCLKFRINGCGFYCGLFFYIPLKKPYMPVIQMSVRDYAKKIKNCSRQAVLKAIKDDAIKRLPNVVSFKKVGEYYVLDVKQ